MKEAIFIETIKILDIGYITTLYFIFAIIFSYIVDKIFGNYDINIDKKKNLARLWFEVIIQMWLIGIVTYLVRELVKKIPFPFRNDNIERVPELQTASIFFFILLTYQLYFRDKLQILYDRTKYLITKKSLK